jgi:lysophospholipase L1-like esterase
VIDTLPWQSLENLYCQSPKRNFCSYNPEVKDVSLFFLFLLVACQVKLPDTPSGGEDMRAIRYLALGDSYTIGESVPTQDCWPKQLAKMLEAEGFQAGATVIARTGWTTGELWQGIQAGEIQPPYDLVSLLIGVNNQYRGYKLDEYRKQFVFLLKKSIEYAGGEPNRVIVLSIPDWGVTPFASGRDREQIAEEIDAFNSVNREESEKAGAHYVDITPVSRQAVTEPAWVASDGLHPSGEMYTLWAEKVLPVARDILK